MVAYVLLIMSFINIALCSGIFWSAVLFITSFFTGLFFAIDFYEGD